MSLLYHYIPVAHDAKLIRPPKFKAGSPSNATLIRSPQFEVRSSSDVTLTRLSQFEAHAPGDASSPGDASPGDTSPGDASPGDASPPGNAPSPPRARWGSVMVSKYTRELIDVVEDEAKAAQDLMADYGGKFVMTEIWPFLPRNGSTDSAWPHQNGSSNGPLLVYFGWDGENDETWINQMKEALGRIRDVALREGCTTSDAPVYCNTTLADQNFTTLEQIYRDNLADLSALRTKYDPHDVMSLTGGFRIPHAPTIADGTYTIKNANYGRPLGAVGLPGPIAEPGFVLFRILLVPDGPEVYTIDNQDHFAVKMEDNVVSCQKKDPDTWKIIPKSRRRNQLEYRITNLDESECWVRGLSHRTVQCLPVGEVEDEDTALWRFQRLQ